ncbi:hypothetical protein FQA39_LY14400 [Lamprigera yunnana]|nr:hypothetical protein FQA39_LY14400 [Lamprigera yunnana]
MSDTENKIKDEWMIRPCKVYLEEYKDCRSIRARLHQQFVYGKSLDCTQWRKDYDNCTKWNDFKNVQAANTLVKSENDRRLERLRAHYGNTVWSKRSSPPENWNDPLPEYLQKEYEHSFLYVKSKEFDGKEVPNSLLDDISSSTCAIM